MIMIINARRSFTVQDLADEFGLSTRTITRDLQELSELGIPIYSIQGRGGGYKLLRERLLPPISFTEGEAIALFFACHSLGYFGSLPFGEDSESALHKFYHYLPSDVKDKIDEMKERVMIWSPYRHMSADVLQTLLQAIMGKSVVTITYNTASGLSTRDVQPIGLYTSSGFWYCPAFCMQKQEMRQFRTDRIVEVQINESVPYREDIAKMTLADKPDKEHLEQNIFYVELTKKGVWQLESNPRFAPFIARKDDGSGIAEVTIAKEDISFYVDLIWPLAGDAKVVGPIEAIAYVKRKIAEMKSIYGLSD
nr:YafY family protein [Paenibacillus sp. GSMTC-2017]